jgi:hypothetical protein
MRKSVTALVFAFLSFSALAAAVYSVEDTDIGTLMENPQTHAVLEKYLPNTISNAQFPMAYGFTLQFISAYDETGELTEENLEKINVELSKISAEGQ